MDGKEDEGEGRNTTSSSSRRPSTPKNKQRTKRQRRGRPRRPEAKKPPLNARDARWEDMYDRLVRYRAEHGHCDVPSRPAGGGDLGCWVTTQRSEYRMLMRTMAADDTTSGRRRRPEDGRFSRTVPERMERLRALGFRFRRPREEDDDDDDPGVVGGGSGGGTGTSTSSPPSPEATTPAASRTRKVRAEAVRAAFASTSSPGGVGLAFRRALEDRAAAEAEKPVAKRRRVVATAAADEDKGKVMKRRPGLITGGQEERWNEMFRRLMSYRAEHGHCDVPISLRCWGDDEDLATLGRWVSVQRTAYRKALPALTAKRIRLLEGQGFTWKIDQGCGVRNRRRSTGQGSKAKPTKEGPTKESDSKRGQCAVGGNQLDASRVGEDDVEKKDDGEAGSG